MSKAKFNSQDVVLALTEFMQNQGNTAPTVTSGLGYNGDITVYKGKQDGQSKGPIDGYLEDVQPWLDSE
jgi:hypothetical protein